MIRPAVVALLAALTVTGCSGDPKDDYCKQVTSHQAELGEVLGAGGNTALIKALPIFEDLREHSPQDIRDDWTTFAGAVSGLRDALDDAGVDAATYQRDDPPAGVTAKQRAAIDAAARRLTDPATVAAFEAVQQEARDVCGTPLSI